MDYILEVKDLFKSFPKVQAVNGINFGIREGICFGLLGPNGAGKTTTIEIMEGITHATSGEVLFRGKPKDRSFSERIGIQFQSTALQDFLTGRELLLLFQSFYTKTRDIEELIQKCALTEFVDRDSDKLSGGQRQRLLLALALINNPDLVFLDEPTTGLDPQARRNFWDLVQGIKAEKKTVVLTTHYMEEAYLLCDEIAIMDQGKIIAQGSPNELLKKYFSGVLIQIPKPEGNKLKTMKLPGRLIEEAEWVEIQTDQVNETLQELLKQGVALEGFRVRSQTLEDLFLELTGKALRA